MNELPTQSDQGLSTYEDQPLLPSQVALKTLTDEMLQYKPSADPTFVAFDFSDINPQTMLERVRTESFSDLIFPEGEILPSPVDDETERLVDQGKLTTVKIIAQGWEYPKYRRTEYEEVLDFPGEEDWTRKLAVEFIYDYDGTFVKQVLSLSGDSITSEQPSIGIEVFVDDDPEYGGFEENYRDSNDEEAARFMELMKELFEKWKAENPDRVAAVEKDDTAE